MTRRATVWIWVALLVLTILVAVGALRSLDQAALDLAQRGHWSVLDLAASLVGVLGTSEVTLGIALGLGHTLDLDLCLATT